MALALACSPAPEVDSTGTWVGTITTEDGVTTVVNESGSVWGGEIELEETLSIGAEVGDEPYLFGDVRTVAATSDRIYVVDRQLAVVRVFDSGGTHLFDIGREGDGPGEFRRPWTIGIGPDDRLIVQDQRRVTIFNLDGDLIETWPYRGAGRLVVAFDGTVFLRWNRIVGGERSSGYVAIAPDGSEGRRITGPAFDYGQWEMAAEQGDSGIGAIVRYAPGTPFAVLPSGALVHGISETYRFEIEHANGRRTVVERTVALPPVPEVHRSWLTRYWTARMRSVQPDWSWDVNPVPEHKPAFHEFAGDRYGRIWVRRMIGVEDVADCDWNLGGGEVGFRRECWRDIRGFDVFEEETGRFLGQVAEPYGVTSLQQWPAFVEDGFLIAVEDDAGTIMVKRYRFVLPGER